MFINLKVGKRKYKLMILVLMKFHFSQFQTKWKRMVQKEDFAKTRTYGEQ